MEEKDERGEKQKQKKYCYPTIFHIIIPNITQHYHSYRTRNMALKRNPSRIIRPQQQSRIDKTVRA